jgi:hypothetical protein
VPLNLVTAVLDNHAVFQHHDADSSITQVYGGTGLDLAIVRDYTKLLMLLAKSSVGLCERN